MKRDPLQARATAGPRSRLPAYKANMPQHEQFGPFKVLACRPHGQGRRGFEGSRAPRDTVDDRYEEPWLSVTIDTGISTQRPADI